MYNFPYGMPPIQAPSYAPRQEIIRVNGRPGAEALSLAPNSSVLALDENDPVLWVAQTDGAGYKTLAAYSIEPVKQQAPVDMNALLERVSKLEDYIYAESDSGKPEQEPKKKQ